MHTLLRQTVIEGHLSGLIVLTNVNGVLLATIMTQNGNESGRLIGTTIKNVLLRPLMIDNGNQQLLGNREKTMTPHRFVTIGVN